MGMQGMDEMLPSDIPQGQYMVFIASPVTISLLSMDQTMIGQACAFVDIQHSREKIEGFKNRRDHALLTIRDYLGADADDPDQYTKVQRASMYIVWLAWNDPHKNLRDYLATARWITFGMSLSDFHMQIGETDDEYEEVRDAYMETAQRAAGNPRVLH